MDARLRALERAGEHDPAAARAALHARDRAREVLLPMRFKGDPACLFCEGSGERRFINTWIDEAGVPHTEQGRATCYRCTGPGELASYYERRGLGPAGTLTLGRELVTGVRVLARAGSQVYAARVAAITERLRGLAPIRPKAEGA